MQLSDPPMNPSKGIEVPPGWVGPKPIISALVEGQKGSGKTHIVAQIVRKYVDAGLITRVFVVTPTYFTNQHLFTFCGVQPEDAYLNASQGEAALKDIVRKIRFEHDTWRTAHEHQEIWMKFKAGKTLMMSERMLLESWNGNQPPMPGKLIRPCLILDDLQSTPLLTNSKYFINLMLRARHVCHSPQVGLNVFTLCQSLKSGQPRALRSNNNYIIIFPTRDRTVLLQDIYPEVSGKLSKSQFLAIFERATSSGQHSHLVIDMTQNPVEFRAGVSGPVIEIPEE